MRGSISTYGQKLDDLRETITRAIAPDKIPLLLEDLAKTDWQALLLSLQVQWRACDNCGEFYRARFENSRVLFCSQCYTEELKREANKVYLQCFRAESFGCRATLTLKEWLAILDYFEWKCAFCKAPYSDLDHFIPVTKQGGTTKDNCIPTCHTCNMRKDNLHPEEITRIPRADIERVKHYLEHATGD